MPARSSLSCWSWAAARAASSPSWPLPTPRTTIWSSTSPTRCSSSQSGRSQPRIKGVITAEDTVSRIYINFCNPWSKNGSSHKHRLTYPRQLINYREFLKDGGEIYFKTDDDDLFRDSLTYFPASGYDIVWQTYDLHENEPEWNIRTEHEGMFTEMGIKIKALIARKKAGDDSVTWVEPKVLKKLAAQAEAEASARAEGEGNV